MKYPMPKNFAEAKAEKARQQENFINLCKSKALSPEEALERASFFPLELAGRMRVVEWPKI